MRAAPSQIGKVHPKRHLMGGSRNRGSKPKVYEPKRESDAAFREEPRETGDWEDDK
jgi:hypothetical protein